MSCALARLDLCLLFLFFFSALSAVPFKKYSNLASLLFSPSTHNHLECPPHPTFWFDCPPLLSYLCLYCSITCTAPCPCPRPGGEWIS